MRGVNTNQKNTFVVDTSFVLAYLLPDEKESMVEELFSKFEGNKISFIAPTLLVFETVNALRSAVIQNRQTFGVAELLIESFLNMDIRLEKVDAKEVFHLAVQKGITAYDASYVWLAKRKQITLLTLEQGLEQI